MKGNRFRVASDNDKEGAAAEREREEEKKYGQPISWEVRLILVVFVNFAKFCKICNARTHPYDSDQKFLPTSNQSNIFMEEC